MPQSLLALLHRANQIGAANFAASVGSPQVTPRQIQVLAAINANEGSSQAAIVELTGIDRSTLADITRRLQKWRLITRRPCRTDARAYSLELTDAGQSILDKSKPALVVAEDSLLAALTETERAMLLALLGKIVEQPQSIEG